MAYYGESLSDTHQAGKGYCLFKCPLYCPLSPLVLLFPLAIPQVNREKALNIEVRWQVACVCVFALWAWVCLHACFLFLRSHTRPCETVMWPLKFNNFRGTIGDSSLKSTRPFLWQPSKGKRREGRREGGKKSHLTHSCTHPLLFEAISHWSRVRPLELSMQALACVTGASNLSGYCRFIILSSRVNALIFYPSWRTIGLK